MVLSHGLLASQYASRVEMPQIRAHAFETQVVPTELYEQRPSAPHKSLQVKKEEDAPAVRRRGIAVFSERGHCLAGRERARLATIGTDGCRRCFWGGSGRVGDGDVSSDIVWDNGEEGVRGVGRGRGRGWG